VEAIHRYPRWKHYRLGCRLGWPSISCKHTEHCAYFNTPAVSFYVFRNVTITDLLFAGAMFYWVAYSAPQTAHCSHFWAFGPHASALRCSWSALRHNLEITYKGADPERNDLLRAGQFTTNISTRDILWRLESTEICFRPTLLHTRSVGRGGGTPPFYYPSPSSMRRVGLGASKPRPIPTFSRRPGCAFRIRPWTCLPWCPGAATDSEAETYRVEPKI